ncbi:MAG: hypothetical protein ACTHMC_10090, partial [Pseudobacter sp.]|uniref:hypothetical protein n=1 Tax=Pseudobacter sp. TaxID=2045420 RepID=UPI003F7D3033
MKVVLLLMVVLISSCSQKGFKAASKGIRDSCGKRTAKSQWAHQLRMQLYESGKLPAIAEPSDTLYFMHTSNIQTGAYRARIWNRQAVYTYLFVNGKLNEDKSGYFSDVMMEVVRQ